jgi:hypothetical protein
LNSWSARGVGLYNSALAGLPKGESPLDLVVDRVEVVQVWRGGRRELERDSAIPPTVADGRRTAPRRLMVVPLFFWSCKPRPPLLRRPWNRCKHGRAAYEPRLMRASPLGRLARESPLAP